MGELMHQARGVLGVGPFGKIEVIANGKGLGFQLFAEVFGIAAKMHLNLREFAAKMRLQPFAHVTGQLFALGAFGLGQKLFASGFFATQSFGLGCESAAEMGIGGSFGKAE